MNGPAKILKVNLIFKFIIDFFASHVIVVIASKESES